MSNTCITLNTHTFEKVDASTIMILVMVCTFLLGVLGFLSQTETKTHLLQVTLSHLIAVYRTSILALVKQTSVFKPDKQQLKRSRKIRLNNLTEEGYGRLPSFKTMRTPALDQAVEGICSSVWALMLVFADVLMSLPIRKARFHRLLLLPVFLAFILLGTETSVSASLSMHPETLPPLPPPNCKFIRQHAYVQTFIY